MSIDAIDQYADDVDDIFLMDEPSSHPRAIGVALGASGTASTAAGGNIPIEVTELADKLDGILILVIQYFHSITAKWQDPTQGKTFFNDKPLPSPFPLDPYSKNPSLLIDPSLYKEEKDRFYLLLIKLLKYRLLPTHKSK
jgi:hypothetical protein